MSIVLIAVMLDCPALTMCNVALAALTISWSRLNRYSIRASR